MVKSILLLFVLWIPYEVNSQIGPEQAFLVGEHYSFDRCEWLFDKKSFNWILIVSAALFVLSYILMLNNIGKPNLVRMLTVPLMAAMVFYAVKYIFFKIYNRNPEDTFWSMDIRQMRDGIFNFLFWVLGTLLPIVITYKLLP